MDNNNSLTNVNIPSSSATLTDHTVTSFAVTFGPRLDSKYHIGKCKDGNEQRAVGKFLADTVGKDWSQIDKTYLRRTDDNHQITIGNTTHQIIHYGPKRGIRLHGYIHDKHFIITKVDPSHSVHNDGKRQGKRANKTLPKKG